MTSLAVNEIVFGNYRPVESVIDEIDKVTVDSVNYYLENKIDLSQASGILLGTSVSQYKDWWEGLEL